MKTILTILTSILIISACMDGPKGKWQEELDQTEWLHQSMSATTDVIVHDIFSPPVASRIYAYVSLAAHEAFRQSFGQGGQSIVRQLNEYQAGDLHIDRPELIDPVLAANAALIATAKALVFTEAKMEAHKDSLVTAYKAAGISKSVLKESVAYGEAISKVILKYADSDNYKETRSYPKYSIAYDDASWKPTPPAYMDGIEPSWNTIRPFILDAPDQFKPVPPTDFDMEEGSPFYKEVVEVYDAVNDADPEQQAIASFWDCNPYVLNVTGHVMHATKKITPGGHWINITALASRLAELDAEQSLNAYAYTSVALADAFISCWDEKYRSKLIRPETVINEHLDPTWRPLLQTPPFPEYTSGHSVISAAAATVLTQLFNDNFAFDDNTEVKYGLPVRSYTSFMDAALEAAVSRLYGGIHYRPAIDNGVTQGFAVGEHIKEQLAIPALRTKKIPQTVTSVQ